MSEEVKTVEFDGRLKQASDIKPKVDDGSIKEDPLAHLRVIPVTTIDLMLKQVYNANKEAFDLYFNLIQAKDAGRIQAKPKEVGEVNNDKS